MEIRHSIMKFACNMEEKLRIHDESKGRAGWIGMDPKKLLEMLMDEVLELTDEICKDTPSNKKIIEECADIANFSMMISDISRNIKGDNSE